MPQIYLIVDFITKLPLVAEKDTILVVCNKLFKMAHFVAVKEGTSVEELVRLFRDNIQKLHGLPVVATTHWNCCGNHQTQSPTITQRANLLKRISSRNFTRELDKEPLLNQSPIYTNVSWSMLLIIRPALLSMLQPHVCLTSYSRPPCILHVP